MLPLPVVLDISYKAIFGLNFQRTFSGITFTEAHHLAFSELSPEDFGQGLLTTFVKKHYHNNTGVYLNLPYEASFVRELNFPFVERRKVEEVLSYELESMLPYTLEEVVYNYYLYPNLKENKTRVIAIGSDKRNLFPYLEMLKQNNITVLGIYSPLDALFHLYPYTKQTSCTMLHIASTFSLVIVIKDGEWFFSRTLPLGYDNLVYWLAHKWKKSFEESEKFFLNLPPGGAEERSFENFGVGKGSKLSRSQAKLLMQSADEFGNLLEGELRLTLKSIPNKVYEEMKSRLPIVLSSDLKNQTLLEGILMKKVEYPIISFPYHQTPMAPLPQDQTINFGGVLSQTSNGMNFLKKDLKKFAFHQENNFKETPFYISLSVGFFLLFSSFFVDFYSKIKVIDIVKKKNQEVYKKYFGKTPPQDTDVLEAAKKHVTQLRRETEIFNVFYRDKSFSEVIVKFNELFPEGTDIEIDGFIYTPKKISFDGKAQESSMIAELKANAEKYRYFDVLNCNQRTTPSKTGRKWKFKCNVNLKSTSQSKKEKK